MGTTAWQRQLLSTLTRLDDGIGRLDKAVVRLDESVARLEDGQREMRDDIRTLTRVVVRRFGTAGAATPQIGDHVLFHARAEVVLPAVVVAIADGNRLDLEVFGADLSAPSRFPKGVQAGTAPGCWSYPV